MQPKTPPSGRRGFVLVMALCLIAVAGISMAGLARESLQRATHAARAQERLQRHWGALSCQRLLLGNAETLLAYVERHSSDDPIRWPLPAERFIELQLGKLLFTAIVADEQAKVGLNVIHQRAPESVTEAVSSFVQSAGSSGLEVNIRSPQSQSDQDRQADVFKTWAQVFDFSNRLSSEEAPAALFEATHELTCWGSGRLNARRASDEAIRTVCRSEVSGDTVENFLAVRREDNPTGLRDLVQRSALKREDQNALRQLLTDQSRCYSLWLFVHGPHRTWASLYVDAPGADGERIAFHW